MGLYFGSALRQLGPDVIGPGRNLRTAYGGENYKTSGDMMAPGPVDAQPLLEHHNFRLGRAAASRHDLNHAQA